MSASHGPLRQADDRLPGAKLGWTLVATVVFCLILVGVSSWLMSAREGVLRKGGKFPERQLNPRHAVQGVREHLFTDYDESALLHDAQRRALEHYGWVDQKAGTVHIPIERAYDLLLSEEK